MSYGSTTHTGTYLTGTAKINQDFRLIIPNLFLQTEGREDLPTFSVFLVCDGHGPSGHIVSTFIIEKYPSILSSLIIKGINEVLELK